MKSRWFAIALGALAALGFLLLAPAAFAGEFSIDPVRLDLGPGTRSSAIAIRNEGDRPLGFELQAKEWTQDAGGQDRYSDAPDLIFFPKIITVPAGQSRIVRVGVRVPATTVEKTYRLFIEELPTNVDPSEAKGPQISFLFRVGAPIFVAPLKAQDGIEIEGVALAQGELTLTARNTGNRHQVVEGIRLLALDAAGNEVYATTVADRYLLAGAAKSYRAAVPPERCNRIAAVDVDFKTDRGSTRRHVEVTGSACRAR